MNAIAWTEDLKSREGLQRLWTGRGPGLVASLLAIAIAAQAALLLTSQPGAPLANPTAALRTAPPRAAEVNVQAIVDAHLFGAPATRPADSATAPQTSLPLVLAGLLANSDPNRGSAIVGSSAASAKFVSVGGAVEGGARLHAVYHDRVVLERNGALESLYLPKNFSMSTQAMSAAANRAGGPAGATPGQRLQVIANNNTLFNGLARVQAVLAQGKLIGYRLFPTGANSQQAFVKLGLISGDLLTAINGTPLDDPNKSNDILQTLASAASASVTVSRNGTPTEVNLNLESVASAAEAAIAADQAAEASRNGNGPGGQFRPGGGPGGGQGGFFPPSGRGGPQGGGGRTPRGFGGTQGGNGGG
jgi:general secretion pathway protein C